MESASKIFTVGYGQHNFATLASRLKSHDINLLVDVRSNAFSQYQTEFRSGTLDQVCERHGIEYVFMGDRIGGKPALPELLTEGRPDFEKVRFWPPFVAALEEVIKLGSKQKIALLCGCSRPMRCHRGLLLSPELIWRGATVHHLVGNRILSHAEAVLDERQGQFNLFG